MNIDFSKARSVLESDRDAYIPLQATAFRVKVTVVFWRDIAVSRGDPTQANHDVFAEQCHTKS